MVAAGATRDADARAGGRSAVKAELDLPADALGLTAPSSEIHLRVLKGSFGWTIMAWSAAGDADPIRAWLETNRVAIVRSGTSRNRRVVWAHAVALPGALDRLLAGLAIQDILMRADGVAIVTVEGPRDVLAGLLVGGHDGVATPLLRSVHSADPVRMLLTPRQHAAFMAAYEQGYYEIPRRTNLRALARGFGVSAASLSELLRRAEARFAEQYVGRLQGPEAAEESAALALEGATDAAPRDGVRARR